MEHVARTGKNGLYIQIFGRKTRSGYLHDLGINGMTVLMYL